MVYPNVRDMVTVLNGTPNGTLFVSVDGTYGKKIVDPTTRQLVSLEDCARGYWTQANLAAAHGYDCDWIMARLRGKIVGVWKINRKKGWMDPSNTPKSTWPSDRPKDRPRSGCELIPVDKEVWNRFVGKEVHLGRNQNSLRGYFI